MKDVYGQALLDFLIGQEKELLIHTSYGNVEEMPVEVFFREPSDFTPAEILAINNCKGRILDIGAGAGSLSLFLQHKGMEITALDQSALALEVMKKRGVNNLIKSDIFQLQNFKADTLLLMMNGIGLAGDLEGLEKLLCKLKSLLNKGGKVIFDSSDIAYLYKDCPLPNNGYYGELTYWYEYQGFKSNPFKWLYIDKSLMKEYATKAGFKMQVIDVDDYDQYLAVLTEAD
jgi:SAM-dependent methyltransferase